jgi:hypothetical protein
VAQAQAFRNIASIAVEVGIVFAPASVAAQEIRKEVGYAEVRILISGELAKARCKAQIDISFGDAVTPGPVDATYPMLRAQALKATFERRGMAVPAELPVGLTDEFADNPARQALWRAFGRKNEITFDPLPAIVDRLRVALGAALNRVAA